MTVLAAAANRQSKGTPKTRRFLMAASQTIYKGAIVHVNASGLAIPASDTAAQVCVGIAASGAAWLLSAGAKGKRFVLPNSEVMIHQPLGGAEGQASDIEITAKHILSTRDRLNKIMAKNTGQSLKKIEQDVDRDFFMTAEESVKYGIVDKVLQ